jgi:hypothetical protein
MTVTLKNVPYRLQEGDGNDLHETPGRLVVEILADWASKIGKRIAEMTVY